MGWSCSMRLLLLLLLLGPGALSLLRYRYECREQRMQLEAHPSRGRSARIRVLDELGSPFDVANCSICLHWLHSRADGAIVFSSGYEGCHVLLKEDHYILRVQLEEMLPNGAPLSSYEVNMTCPQPPGNEHPAGGHGNGIRHSQPGVPVPLSQPGLLHQASQSSISIPGSQLMSQVHQEQVPPLARAEPQEQPGMGHPGAQHQPGRLHSVLQTHNQPGLMHSMGQNQAGHLRPGVQTQTHPVLVHQRAQTQAGALRAGLAPQNQPGLVQGTGAFMHTGAQTHTGFIRPGAHPPNQPGLTHPNPQPHSQGNRVHAGLQSQTGLIHPSHSQPGLSHPGLQSRPGLMRPGLHAQPQPGLGRPGLQPQAQPGLMRPGLQSQPSLLQSTALFYPSAGAGTPLSREQCQVAVGRMPCVAPQGRDACLQAGCCYDDMDRAAPCYYGNTATVQCLLDAHFVLVVPRGLSTQPYNLDSVRLASNQPGCEPLRITEAFVMFRFAVTQCGTTVQAIEDRLIYENQLISTIDVQGSPRGSITRDSIYILQARCIYNASELLPLRMEVAIPTTAAPVARLGPLGLQLRIATDESYSSYHPAGDFPLVKVLRDPIYVEVRLLQKTDPNLVLVLHHCWASPSTEPTAEPQWPILVEGCPFEGDNYRTQLVPVGPASPQVPFPSHYQRFVISTFTFVEPPSMAVLEGEVFISCSASVCHLAQPEPCRPSCHLGVPSRARRATRARSGAMGTVSSQGSIAFPMVAKVGGGG
ncbi:zona pellucida sperm-binding protein 1 [Neopsephotus bourkii]|uniref:zona pellucida sperm-binding protein 1 n=1 Tax=Neopsephotus bourkii TaxID=309878 RepID=UPI002AA58DA3|nr:zona pellucida sperm-binding protein 1 [Neopsephotus bourkii]